MEFKSLHELIVENEQKSQDYVLFLEDEIPRTKLIEAYMAKYIPEQKYVVFNNSHDAAIFSEQHYDNIKWFSIDFWLLDGMTSEAFALYLKRKGNDGSNVFCHSNSPEGAERIQEILPHVKIKQVPTNISCMVEF
jgi:stalled ribosome rescue protein Dom34